MCKMIQRKRKNRSIRSILAFNSFIPILLTVLMFSILYYTYTSSILIEREKERLEVLADRLDEMLESEQAKMSTLALNLAYSPQLKSLLKKHLDLYNLSSGTQQQYINTSEIINTIREIAGPYKMIPQINIIIPGLHTIGTGIYDRIFPLDKNKESLVSEYNLEAGALSFSTQHSDAYASQMQPNHGGMQFVSLFKTLFDDYHNPIAILEIEQYAQVIFGEFESREEHIYVFDSQGVQVYPMTTPLGSSYASIAIRDNLNSIVDFDNPVSGKREIVALSECIESGWIILTVTSGSRYLKPIYTFMLIMILVSIMILVIGSLFSLLLSRRITKSLHDLSERISKLEWGNPNQGHLHDTSGVNEVNELHLSFQEMNLKLDHSMATLLAERTLETQSRILALQAQMDPHFIYNMMTNISIMAEQGEDDEIISTISHLTHILRYISNGSSVMAPLDEELTVIEHYISCMHIRFEELLQFSVIIPEGMAAIPVPRHSVLPLIENSIKFGLDSNPPWRIQIRGSYDDNHWELSVEDSGPGFTSDSLEKLNSQIERCRSDKAKQLEFHINGLGLINLYSRLLIFYEEELTFIAENTETGARITIGGTLEPRSTIHLHDS